MFQKQTTRAKDKYLKRQTDIKVLIFHFLLILFSKNLASEELNFKIIDYLEGLSSFSSKIIQSDGVNMEEGFIYIQDEKIRLDYNKPDRTIKINKEKGVYINHELREEEFFSTKKNDVKTFYNIFLKKNFFSSLTPKENKKEIVFEKIIKSESTETNLKIFFESNPILIRKIISKTGNDFISISFYDHNYYSVFKEDFFSFVPIYLD